MVLHVTENLGFRGDITDDVSMDYAHIQTRCSTYLLSSGNICVLDPPLIHSFFSDADALIKTASFLIDISN